MINKHPEAIVSEYDITSVLRLLSGLHMFIITEVLKHYCNVHKGKNWDLNNWSQ